MKRKNLRKILPALIGICGTSGGIIAGTLAYFSSSDKVTISVSSGQISIRLNSNKIGLISGSRSDGTSFSFNEEDHIKYAPMTSYFAGGDIELENGGTIKLADEQASPYLYENEEIIYKITFDNASNVNVKYKVIYIETFGDGVNHSSAIEVTLSTSIDEPSWVSVNDLISSYSPKPEGSVLTPTSSEITYYVKVSIKSTLATSYTASIALDPYYGNHVDNP